MTTEIETGGFFSNFLDKIWLQLAVTTVITVLWLVWIIYEIIIKAPPA